MGVAWPVLYPLVHLPWLIDDWLTRGLPAYGPCAQAHEHAQFLAYFE